jgi:hypothetical protein
MDSDFQDYGPLWTQERAADSDNEDLFIGGELMEEKENAAPGDGKDRKKRTTKSWKALGFFTESSDPGIQALLTAQSSDSTWVKDKPDYRSKNHMSLTMAFRCSHSVKTQCGATARIVATNGGSTSVEISGEHSNHYVEWTAVMAYIEAKLRIYPYRPRQIQIQMAAETPFPKMSAQVGLTLSA